MIITIPKDFTVHPCFSNGMKVPHDFQLLENGRYSVTIQMDKDYPLIAVGDLSGKKIKEKNAVEVARRFGITNLERFTPRHPTRCVYFRILNE